MTFDQGTTLECASGKRLGEQRRLFVSETLYIVLAGRLEQAECFLARALHLDRHQQAKGDLTLVLFSHRKMQELLQKQ